MGGRVKIALLLAPALLVIGVLFAGGLFAAVVQSLGYLPAIGQTEISSMPTARSSPARTSLTRSC